MKNKIDDLINDIYLIHKDYVDEQSFRDELETRINIFILSHFKEQHGCDCDFTNPIITYESINGKIFYLCPKCFRNYTQDIIDGNFILSK